ncbi:T9SS type B sorting domain-containing protein [Seonamhaeicola marinus]|uniref:Gliding motility-associated C-terminal domain-containing protein n=1 Tax=Seonamhaeicola marinus TaxID=1912246 RepID=A0A5D0HNN9_9FLAO|nr:gliding motility-associated C-terminal domain-containing protein [Seonamhaeicola marinus]TYA72009.1 gliding motility-associated C-terminal domain-containing protein [Seonamhaeicola marinus]
MKNFTLITLMLCAFTLSSVNAQVVIGKPNLGFTQACASESFNTYNVTFVFSPPAALTGSNQFIIELSDETGDFATPTVIYSSPAGSVTTSPATLTFSLPTTIAGEAFKIRIKSTSPAATSSSSDSFAAYYKIQDTPFTINNLIESAVFCSGDSYLLTIDNPGGPMNDSPLQYPSLTFNWFKETSETTSVFVASGQSLEVTEAGTYFAETNYGTCTSNSFSNKVVITEAASSETNTSISSSLGNPYCHEIGPTILSSIQGESYQWFKDGEQINGATDQMYETNEAGAYSVIVDLGDCSATALIDLENSGFNSSIDVAEINELEEGETLTATVTTTAISPQFQWFKDEVTIAGETNSSLDITASGNYKVIITQNIGCSSTKEFVFRVTEQFPNVEKIPNIVSPNGDNINDTWIIPKEFTSGSETQVMIINSQGKTVLNTNDYQNNWPENLSFKDVNPVYFYIITPKNSQTRKGSITVVK